MPTKEQIGAALNMVRAVADSIRELKRVPSGTLYAQVMGVMSIQEYEWIIARLVGAGLVRKESNELIWCEDV